MEFAVASTDLSSLSVNPAKRLTQKQIGSELVRRRRISISLRKLELVILTTEYAGCSKKVHHRVRDPLLDKLHIQNRLAVSDQRAIYGYIETPDQATKLIGEPTQFGAAHRNLGNPHGRTEPMLASCPRFCETPLACRFHHRVVNFLEFHARPAHPHQRDKRSEHFVRAFANLVNASVAHHSFQRAIDKIR